MLNRLKDFHNNHRSAIYSLFQQLLQKESEGSPFLLRSDLQKLYSDFLDSEQGAQLNNSIMSDLFSSAQEISRSEPWIYLAARVAIGKFRYFRIHSEEVEIDEIDVTDYLEFKERLVGYTPPTDEFLLELDMTPFNRD